MKALTTEGRKLITEIADRYNVQPQTIEMLLKAIVRGNGTMAQFNIAELGGQGQWMKGGMTMVGDMFNNSLRSTVDKLCSELAELAATTVLFEVQESSTLGDIAASSDFDHSRNSDEADLSRRAGSWPAIFGNPTSSGSQNNFRYAYFEHVHRLVIEENGRRTIYDTKHHQITGISQQQGAAASFRFASREGVIDLGSLEKISDPERPRQPTPEMVYDATGNAITEDRSPEEIVLGTIEKLNMLFERGQITEEEFAAKKKELLERL